MKVYFVLILLTWLGPQAINALPKSSGYIYAANCSQYADGEFLPDRSSCAHYYVCAGGKALRKFCARGLYFDAETGVCNMAYLVDCEINLFGGGDNLLVAPSTVDPSTEAPSTVAPSAVAPQLTTQTAFSKSTAVLPLSSINDCATLSDGTILLDMRHCRSYYICTNKRGRRIVCALGLWYDRVAQMCRPRSEVTNCPAGRN